MIPLRRRASVPLVVLLLLAVVGARHPATAHTDLASSSPDAGEVVTAPIDEILLTFEEALQDGGDHLIGLYAPDGDTRVDLNDTRAVSPDEVAVAVGALTETGVYEVRWVVIADDGDEQRGEYTFEVTASATTSVTQTESATTTDTDSESKTAAASETTTSSGAPTEPVLPTPASNPSSGAADDDGGAPVLPIVVIVVLVGGLAIAAIRNRSAR